MPGPGDPQSPPPAPSRGTEWWRRYHGPTAAPWWRDLPGGALLDQAVKGVEAAGNWLNREVLGIDPAQLPAAERRLNELLTKRSAPPVPAPIVPELAPDPATAAVAGAVGRGAQQFGGALVDRYQDLWTPAPITTVVADKARQAIAERTAERRAVLPEGTGIAPLDWMIEAQNAGVPNFTVGALESATTPFDALTNIPAPGVGAAVKGGVVAAKAAGLLPPNVMKALAERLFPKLDAYSKPAGLLSQKTMLKRIDAATDLSPETKTALAELAEQVGARRVQPAEVHAIAEGKAYKPARTVRRVPTIAEGAKQIPGAPYGVTNARQARALRETYLGTMEEGVEGRDWYHDAGGAIRFYANDDPLRANLFAGDLAITSPATAVSGNTGMGVKGYNMATASTAANPIRVVAGRFPTAMGKAIEEAHAAGGSAAGLGLKRDPFQQNLARGGGFSLKTDPPRAVHDIWDAEGHGYMNPDGTPMRAGFGPAQHRFMDAQQDKIIATANERAVGGFTDWEELRTQAAQWVGRKIEAGQVAPEDAAKAFDAYFDDLVAQGSRETLPGATSGHMPELHQPGMNVYRQLLHDILKRDSGVYDDQMRDQIAAGYGALSGRAFEGPGVYKGEMTPGIQTKVLTGSVEVPGTGGMRVLDEGSRRLMDATEATHGILNVQDASAYSRLLEGGSGGIRDLWDVTLPGGTITPDQMQALLQRLGPERAKSIIPIPNPRGIFIGYNKDWRDPEAQQLVFKFLRDMGGDVKQAVGGMGGTIRESGLLQGGYMTNPWDEGVGRVGLGAEYRNPIELIGPEKFDAFMPAMFAKRRAAEARFTKETGGRFTLNPVIDEMRAVIANEGWAGLQKLSLRFGIPVVALAAILRDLGETVPDPSEG